MRGNTIDDTREVIIHTRGGAGACKSTLADTSLAFAVDSSRETGLLPKSAIRDLKLALGTAAVRPRSVLEKDAASTSKSSVLNTCNGRKECIVLGSGIAGAGCSIMILPTFLGMSPGRTRVR